MASPVVGFSNHWPVQRSDSGAVWSATDGLLSVDIGDSFRLFAQPGECFRAGTPDRSGGRDGRVSHDSGYLPGQRQVDHDGDVDRGAFATNGGADRLLEFGCNAEGRRVARRVTPDFGP